jgi:hypothetical protein
MLNLDVGYFMSHSPHESLVLQAYLHISMQQTDSQCRLTMQGQRHELLIMSGLILIAIVNLSLHGQFTINDALMSQTDVFVPNYRTEEGWKN